MRLITLLISLFVLTPSSYAIPTQCWAGVGSAVVTFAGWAYVTPMTKKHRRFYKLTVALAKKSHFQTRMKDLEQKLAIPWTNKVAAATLFLSLPTTLSFAVLCEAEIDSAGLWAKDPVEGMKNETFREVANHYGTDQAVEIFRARAEERYEDMVKLLAADEEVTAKDLDESTPTVIAE